MFINSDNKILCFIKKKIVLSWIIFILVLTLLIVVFNQYNETRELKLRIGKMYSYDIRNIFLFALEVDDYLKNEEKLDIKRLEHLQTKLQSVMDSDYQCYILFYDYIQTINQCFNHLIGTIKDKSQSEDITPWRIESLEVFKVFRESAHKILVKCGTDDIQKRSASEIYLAYFNLKNDYNFIDSIRSDLGKMIGRHVDFLNGKR